MTMLHTAYCIYRHYHYRQYTLVSWFAPWSFEFCLVHVLSRAHIFALCESYRLSSPPIPTGPVWGACPRHGPALSTGFIAEIKVRHQGKLNSSLPVYFLNNW